MSVLLAVHDVRKQPGLTSICGTSDVTEVSVTFRLLGSMQRACARAALRCLLLPAAAAVLAARRVRARGAKN